MAAAGLVAAGVVAGGAHPSAPPPTAVVTKAPTHPAEAPAVPTTPNQALAGVRDAIRHAQARGEIDAGAAQDLDSRLDQIQQALAAGSTSQASTDVGDLIHHLNDLANGGPVTIAGLTSIGAALNQLDALIPASATSPPATTSSAAPPAPLPASHASRPAHPPHPPHAGGRHGGGHHGRPDDAGPGGSGQGDQDG
jgi:hypothetical protein